MPNNHPNTDEAYDLPAAQDKLMIDHRRLSQIENPTCARSSKSMTFQRANF